ncbi:Aldehyde dehydrogenase family 3 member B1 [Halotydeus destructor]|nr:Aldehyde dehydrogenase family 3 member B1 [Halotydeus destructor]
MMSKLASSVLSALPNNNQLTMFSSVVSRARDAFTSRKTRDISFRKTQLRAIAKFMKENEELLCKAVKNDLSKCQFEVVIHELEMVRNEVRSMLAILDKLAKPQYTDKTMVTMLDSTYIYNEPYGLVLVIGAWNYPLMLSLGPMVSAIAAGNAVLVKPSDLAPHSSKILADLLPQYLDKDCYHVVEGGPAETQSLLSENFDYIFYTGSPRVGKIVYQAAAQNLTPVTLELGGKSPVYLDDSVTKLEVALRRILWGKFMNSGQTCIAPDFLMCNKDLVPRIVELAPKVIAQFYGDDAKTSPDYARIINANHFNRLKGLLDTTSGRIVIGGKTDAAEKYISPTVVLDVKPDDPLMSEELFGPILPIMTVSSAQEAVDFVNSREKPLALYVFSNNSAVFKKFRDETSSGACVRNDTVLHISVNSLPFGGVGNSGMGKYMGKTSFDTFSHGKAVLDKDYKPVTEMIASNRYPPYSSTKRRILEPVLKHRKLNFEYIPYILLFVMGFGLAFLIK